MQFSSPLTRFDVVMWFLRVQLWLIVAGWVALLPSSCVAFLLLPISLRSSYVTALFSGLEGVLPLLILLLFPKMLANSALGDTARTAVSGVSDLKFLLMRCVGLSLFIHSLTRAIYGTYMTGSTWLSTGTLTGATMGSRLLASNALSSLVGGTVSLLLGFALAFGPSIRDAFRAR